MGVPGTRRARPPLSKDVSHGGQEHAEQLVLGGLGEGCVELKVGLYEGVRVVKAAAGPFQDRLQALQVFFGATEGGQPRDLHLQHPPDLDHLVVVELSRPKA